MTRQQFLFATLLGLLTLCTYAPVYSFPTVLVDDFTCLTANPRIRQGVTWSGLIWSWTSILDGNWLPFTWLSLMLDAEIYGEWPGGFHITNVVLHGIATILLFACLSNATGSVYCSGTVAALFAVHPLHVESVAWIAERKDVLSICFGMASILFYIRYARSSRSVNYWSAVALYLASLLSKQTLVTLPYLLLLLDFWPLRRLVEQAERNSSTLSFLTVSSESNWRIKLTVAPNVRRQIVEKAPFVLLSTVFCFVAFYSQRRIGAVSSLETIPLKCRLLNALAAYGKYAASMAFPHNLAVFYPHPITDINLLAVVAGGIFIIAVTVAAVVTARRFPFVLVGWLWYIGGLLPLIGIIQIGQQEMADRYSYFPSIGLSICVTWLCATYCPSRGLGRILAALVVLSIVGAFTVATVVQLQYWRSSVALFRRAVEVTPENVFARGGLGIALVDSGDYEEGIACLRRALQEDRGSSNAHFQLGFALQQAGLLSEAMMHYRAAIEGNPADMDSHLNLGILLFEQGRIVDSKEMYYKAITLAQHANNGLETLLLAHMNLGVLLEGEGEYGDALAHFGIALEIDRTDVHVHRCLGAARRRRREFAEAISHFRTILKRRPTDWRARLELAATLDDIGDLRGAEAELDKLYGEVESIPGGSRLIERLKLELWNPPRARQGDVPW